LRDDREAFDEEVLDVASRARNGAPGRGKEVLACR
jgi:hypothetical protein